MNALALFAKVYDLPPALRNPVLSAGIPRVIPVASGLGISLARLDDERCESTMPFSRRSRNHVGTMYMGALLVHAEATMASLAIMTCRPPSFRVVVKRSEADFHAPAKSRVRAVCAPEGDERAALDRCRDMQPGKDELWLTVRSVKDGTDEPVCTTRFLVSVKRSLTPS